jgi:hypothetical protein
MCPKSPASRLFDVHSCQKRGQVLPLRPCINGPTPGIGVALWLRMSKKISMVLLLSLSFAVSASAMAAVPENSTKLMKMSAKRTRAFVMRPFTLNFQDGKSKQSGFPSSCEVRRADGLSEPLTLNEGEFLQLKRVVPDEGSLAVYTTFHRKDQPEISLTFLCSAVWTSESKVDIGDFRRALGWNVMIDGATTEAEPVSEALESVSEQYLCKDEAPVLSESLVETAPKTSCGTVAEAR